MPEACFCEAIRPSLVRQPANTLSGLAFVFVALSVLSTVRLRPPPRGLPAPWPLITILYACALLLVGIGTAFYHASLTFWGQTADVLGMYLVVTALLFYSLVRVRPLTARQAAALYAGCNLVLLYVLISVPQLRRYIFALLVLSVLLLEMRLRRHATVQGNAGYLWGALGLLAFGFGIWALDITRTVCVPMSLIQGHALWHILGAASAALVFVYYNAPEQPERG